MDRKKTWQEKLHDDKGLPSVVTLDGAMAERWHARTMVIPAPVEVDALMRSVPRGKVITLDMIRRRLAVHHGTDTACPLTTGLFAWIAANAAEEAAAQGASDLTPYWRTLKAGGALNPKYPGGIAVQQALLEVEGHIIVAGTKSRPPRVRDFELALMD